MKTVLTHIAAIPLAAILGTAGISAPALADFSMTILHTNDFHSRIEPINKYDSTCGSKDLEEGKCFGGSARFVTKVKERREAIEAAGGNVALFDGGDQFQGSLFYTYYKGKAAAEMMNLIGYDAMTVGNHEFDDGPEVLSGFIDAVDFPILLANADTSGEMALKDKLKGVTIIEKGGEKIGLIGLTPEDTDELSSPGKNIRFLDAIATLKGAVQGLEASGVNKIIALSHSGYGRDLQLAAAVPGIDVIVGGHSNTLLSNTSDRAAGPYPTMVEAPDGGKTAVVQAYAYGKLLGELNVIWDDDGKVVSAEGEPIVMDAAVAEDEDTKARIAAMAEPLDEIRNTVIGATAAPIDGSRDTCRARECEMGDLVADAMLDRVKDQGMQIAIQNGGGLRASIDAGEVTMGEVLSVLPFQNTLATFRLKGSDVIAALENGLSQVEEGGGRFPQVAGIRFSWSRAKPAGERITAIEVMGADGYEPLDPSALYGVVSNNFMRGGGDGYSVFETEATDAYDYGPGLEQVVADYIQATGGYVPKTDGRITEAD
ncbi:bifunctional metallophosphatase/5'-nucleotidase [Breoghania sp. L-A4]|uniref:bifunctional metallophosphatase/5'-nucleotidase n=1 Tax=Breoghania sp. L-A4 TaxID=2304600 RepID=UPI000E360D2C|nr:bifunctional metallophosphatase/5'-nucleotidase [Breoghania sp. L-A4]AXS42111.1 multifunctional 2',3'-cyclic-nucleotide 2'-phosphodiesterase/5'-nucleotidase/3'-nucleotidase [Breoghania sp. L-A4]